MSIATIRQLLNHMKQPTHLHAFDFDRRWPKVRNVLHQPKIARALDAGMRERCRRDLYGPWVPELGPWHYANPRLPERPTVDSPAWYRCYGACRCLAPWCGAIGEAMMPEYRWTVAWGDVHAAAIGFKNSTGIIMDILWGRGMPPREIWNNIFKLGTSVAIMTVPDAIDYIEEQAQAGGDVP